MILANAQYLTISVISLTAALLIPEPIPPDCVNTTLYNESWSVQFVDHFDDLDAIVWQMRYFSNFEHFIANGPLFVILGGPWPISSNFVCSGLSVELAKHTNGAVFYVEHRFYGKSQPVPNNKEPSFSTLTKDQAIEDVRSFIEHQKEHTSGLNASKVILMGSFYGGSLGLWSQHKYPALIQGVVAINAPLLPQKQIPLHAVARAIRHIGGQVCTEKISKAFRMIKQETDDIRYASQYEELFDICQNINLSNILDQTSLFYSLIEPMISMIIGNDRASTKKLCARMLDTVFLDEIEALAGFVSPGYGNQCQDLTFRYLVKKIENTPNVYTWTHQLCAEFGWFTTSPDLFFLSIDLFEALCHSLFQIDTIDSGYKATKLIFEEIMQSESRKIIINSEPSPWLDVAATNSMKYGHYLGVKGETYIRSEFTTISNTDSYELRLAKSKAMDIIFSWLQANDTYRGAASKCVWSSINLLTGLIVFLV